MTQKADRDASVVHGDRLNLDFGKHKIQIDERAKQPDRSSSQRKLPPEPGRSAPATSVPWSEVLNRNQK
jgi:hypothetical protein